MVLVVEASPALSFFLRYILEGDDFDVACVARGDDAILSINKNPPDVVIINTIMPGISGIDICRRMKNCQSMSSIPILLLADFGGEVERIQRLFEFADVINSKSVCGAHVQRRMRFLFPELEPAEKIQLGCGILNVKESRIEIADRCFDISPIILRLLRFFMGNPKRVLSRELLFAEVWQPHSNLRYNSRTVDVHVARLRHALASALSENPIRTVRGFGYYFDYNSIS